MRLNGETRWDQESATYPPRCRNAYGSRRGPVILGLVCALHSQAEASRFRGDVTANLTPSDVRSTGHSQRYGKRPRYFIQTTIIPHNAPVALNRCGICAGLE